MTADELKARAERENVNPYFLAFALVTGARSCSDAFKRDGGGHLFMGWNNDRWTEQAHAEGVPRNVVPTQNGAADRHIAICAAHIKGNPP